MIAPWLSTTVRDRQHRPSSPGTWARSTTGGALITKAESMMWIVAPLQLSSVSRMGRLWLDGVTAEDERVASIWRVGQGQGE